MVYEPRVAPFSSIISFLCVENRSHDTRLSKSLWYNTPMMKRTPLVVRFAVVAAFLLTAAACSEAPVPLDPAYAAEIDQWRADRLERLTSDEGWLTLTGLYWLDEGENTFGSSTENTVVLPDPSIPAVVGTLVLSDDGVVSAKVQEDAGVFVNGEPLTEGELVPDTSGSPDIVTAGRIKFFIIQRGDRFGARVKDPQAPTREAFAGIEHFPTDPAYRVEARFEPYDAVREVAIPTVLDEDTSMLATGLLRFTVNGKEQTLEPYVVSPEADSYFLIFRDGTAGESTYGAGRFMSAEAAGEGGTTTLDFNLAYNPPCAFTPYATCPLPPPQNSLEVAIEAGEMYHGPAH